MLIPLHNTDMLPLIANITYFSSQSFADELDYHSEDESRDVEKQRSFGKTGLQTSHTRCVKCQVIVPCIHHGGGGGGGGGVLITRCAKNANMHPCMCINMEDRFNAHPLVDQNLVHYLK